MSGKQERWTTPEVERLLSLRFRDAELAGFFSRPKTRRNRQVAWVQISERLARELPLASGAARSAAQCEQKLKNLRKELMRVRSYQGRLERGEIVGSLRLGDYWPLLEATLGEHVEAKAKKRAAQAQPRPQRPREIPRQQPSLDPRGGKSSDTAAPFGAGAAKRRREDAEELSVAVDSSVEWRHSEQEEDNETETNKRGRQRQTVELVTSDVDLGGSRQDLEHRVSELEDEVKQMRTCMRTMNAKMNILLSRLPEPGE